MSLKLPVTARGSVLRDAEGNRVCAVENADVQNAFDNAQEIAKALNNYRSLIETVKLFTSPTQGSTSPTGDTAIGWSGGEMSARERVILARGLLSLLGELP